jgi:hypothetical protein
MGSTKDQRAGDAVTEALSSVRMKGEDQADQVKRDAVDQAQKIAHEGLAETGSSAGKAGDTYAGQQLAEGLSGGQCLENSEIDEDDNIGDDEGHKRRSALHLEAIFGHIAGLVRHH